MTARVDLVVLGENAPRSWPLGRVFHARPTPSEVAGVIERELPASTADAWLFWSERLGSPDPDRVREILERPGDVWHAGLRLGTSGLPRGIDHVSPTWMLNRDPDPAIEATSWRLSLDACLVRTDVLRKMGGVRPEFRTLLAAGLELGHRWVRAGVLTRHVGSLAGERASPTDPELPLEDELRFLRYRFGRRWSRWSAMRMAVLGRAPLGRSLRILRDLERRPMPSPAAPYRGATTAREPAHPNASRAGSVTVLIPTVDRYPYLEVLLEQLGTQTIKPLEIVIVDQTAAARRRPDLPKRFPHLPIRYMTLDQAGQCSSRNAGLEASRGDHILFLDDDDEIPNDLIEKHLAALRYFRNAVSSGVAEEDGAGPVPEAFRLIRASDVFPTNNSLIGTSTLTGSGLFDLAYDRGARADADLGMRLYLAGNLMVLNPDIRVLHRHAPSGGLRTHGARVITYASSRQRLTHRHLLSATELYLGQRYFSPAQVREALWHSILGTFSAHGNRGRRILKAAFAVILLPHSLWTLRQRRKVASEMATRYPQIAPWVRQSTAAEMSEDERRQPVH
jgi:glycosyltransferase involved in cell wall biosynthesis